MRHKAERTPKLFADLNTLQFARVMCVVLLAPLTLFMTYTTPHHGIGPDLPRAWHPISMPGAPREDAMMVSVTRDGMVFFGIDRIDPANLSEKVAGRLKDRGMERKVYVRADMRVRWGTVRETLDSVRSAGILRVAFLVDQRRSTASAP